MKNAVLATFFHLISTDKNPQHQYCPAGLESWCKWRVTEATKTTENFVHLPPLHPDVQKHVLPIYESLSDDTLLERCLESFTQNLNESFNACIWRMFPKHLNCGMKSIEIAAYIATLAFNEGHSATLLLMKILELYIGPTCKLTADGHDQRRLSQQARATAKESKEARTIARMERIKKK